MSYILEALKQSEHARRQGKAPALNSLPPLLAAPREIARRRPPAYLPLALGLALIGAGLGWWRPWQLTAEDRLVVQTPLPEASAPQPATSRAADPVEPAPTAPVAASVAPAPEPAGPAVAAAPPAAPVAASEPLIRVDPVATPDTPSPAPPPAALPAAPRPAPGVPMPPHALPAPPERVLGLHELPVELRQSLPPLSLAGFSYADEPKMRMAVINDRILHQGDQAGPGIVLEQIASDGVVLNYRGYRFRPR
ncbi:general secretion pathway protein GspB [Azotobacter salinestris]|uniref:general secretion pathway protein GspB n=1 Tax=Azotobacter salinestris TaxID=69964 RepID=UPI0032DFF29C